MIKMNKAVFLDRDGVLNEDRGLLCKKNEIKILPGVVKALRKLKNKGYGLIVVTSQPVIARGIVSEEEVKELHDFLNNEVENLIDEFYVCPHHPEMHPDVPEFVKKYRIACNCRKPAPGLLIKAAKDFNIDLKKSWMIGDKASDIVAGKSAGCKTIMIKSPVNHMIHASAIEFDKNTKADFYADSLLEATKYL